MRNYITKAAMNVAEALLDAQLVSSGHKKYGAFHDVMHLSHLVGTLNRTAIQLKAHTSQAIFQADEAEWKAMRGKHD